MAPPVSFAQVKAEILARAREIETCDDYHKASLANNYGELISAGLPSLVWAYNAGVIDDYLISRASAADLNTKGIYNVGTTTLFNPSIPIYVLPYATVNVFMFGSSRQDFHCLGGILNMNILSTAHAEITAYHDAQINLSITSSGISCITLNNEAKLTSTVSNSGVVTVQGKGESQTTLTANNNAHLNLYGWYHAVLKYKLTGTSTVSIHQAHESSIVTF